MAKIGLVAVDSHHYPNLPLGKIAAYHDYNPTENCDNENPISNPHTEMQTGEKYPDRNLCDKLIQRGFKNHNRLHVASIIMTGLLASGKDKHSVKRALELADALISEVEKGGEQ